MPAWLIPALKAILPHVGTIVSAASPVFTKKKDDTRANDTTLLQQQVGELQTAAAQNSTHIKELAEQLQATVTALEQVAATAESRRKQVLRIGFIALVVSVLSLALSLYIIF